MKHAMWQVDGGTGLRFSDELAGQQVLLGEANVDVTSLSAAILTKFSGDTVGVERVEEFVLADTPFSASHFKKLLSFYEKGDGLTVEASPRKKRYSFPPGTVMRFH